MQMLLHREVRSVVPPAALQARGGPEKQVEASTVPGVLVPVQRVTEMSTPVPVVAA